MAYNVLITKHIPEEGLVELRKYSHIYMPETEGKSFPREELFRLAPKLDAIIPSGDVISADFIEIAKKLKIISNYGVGYDNLDVKVANKRGIIVTNLPDVVTESTAELTFMIMLAVSRRLIEADRYVRYGNDKNWHPFLFNSHELFGKLLGIIGFGRIGKAVARRALAFGMQVYYFDVLQDRESELEVNFLTFEKILTEMDYITLHVPYMKSTHHLIGKKELNMMKKSSYLINASRGPVVDQNALIKALREKKIKGAALEVFENEPCVPEELTCLPNVVLTPHMGTNTVETNIKMAKEAAKKIIQVFKGEIPANIITTT